METTQTTPKEMKQEPCIGPERERSSIARMVMKMCCYLALLATVTIGMPCSSIAVPPLVYSVENTGTNYPAPPLPTLGNLPLIQPLPDPFAWAADPLNSGGTRSTNFVDWEHHRNEIAAQIENYEIGPKPAVNPTNVTASYSGGTAPGTSGTLTVHVTVNGHTLTLTCAVSIPAAATTPYPVCIGMDSPYGSLDASDFTTRGIAGVTFSESQVSPYGNPSNTDPYHTLYPAYTVDNTGQYSAWAWGVSRVIDGLTLVTNTLPIDLNHIAVTGCSYAGKLALFAGAFDERVALTIAQESGGGGDTSWRYSHTQPNGTVEDIDNTDYNWFANQMQQFAGNNVSYLPEDHHELMAMCAPRALYCTANTDYTWLSNPSAYVCGQACAQIYQTLGIADRFGFNVDGGHSHCAFPSDQESDLQYLLNKFMLGQTNLTQTIRTFPNTGDFTSINYPRWYAWWGTPYAVFPNTSIYVSLPAAVTKGAGTLAGQGSVSVAGTVASNLVVNLTSSNTNLVTTPVSVTIPAGQTNAVFDVTILDDHLLEGDQVITVTASAQFFSNGYGVITIHDNETTTLSVSLPASAAKSAGTLTGSVGMGAPAGGNVTVSLTSSDPSKLVVPPTTIIPTGQTSAVFNLTLVDDNIIDGPQNVSVTAHVPNWTDGSATMTIIDDNPLPDHFALSVVPSPQLIGEPFNVTITALDASGNIVDYRLPVTLSAFIPGSSFGTNTLLNSPATDQSATDPPDYPDYSLGYSFTANTNLYVTHVRSYFGDKVSIWNNNGQLLASTNVTSVPGTWVDTPLSSPLFIPAGVTCRLATHEYGVEYFWSQSLPNTFANGTINETFWDSGDVFPQTADPFTQWYYVDVRYGTDLFSAAINPTVTANFNAGTWSGNMAVLQAATNVILVAEAGPGHAGASIPFNVLATPKLAITAFSNSVVLSWPVAASGFNLEQASTLPNWSTVPGIPAVVGSRYTVTNTPGLAPVYFRLHKP
jgi:hypothetical protein